MTKTKEQLIAELQCTTKRLGRLQDYLSKEDKQRNIVLTDYISISRTYLQHTATALQLRK
jgi:hypothetical protein